MATDTTRFAATGAAADSSSRSSLRTGGEPATEVAILKGMVDASADACWCMEFDQPVDLESPDREVIRQVFENGPRWRFCNQAMARLYRLPPHLDLSERPVNEIFPRNRQNEEFIENLLRSGFEVDAAPALDSRYDGVPMHVENDVRAHIENGKLIRMFGVVRDVSKRRWRENDLKGKLQALEWIMGAIPDALIAFDDFLLITAANPAAAKLFRVDVETLVGTNVRLYLRSPADAGEDPGGALQRALTASRTASELVDLNLDIRTGAATYWRFSGGIDPDGKRVHVAIIRTLTKAGEDFGERADIETRAARR